MDSIKLYFEEIRNDKGLPKIETHELALQAQAGCKISTEKLFKNHLLMVVKIARDYIGKGVPFADLLGEGNVGLITALEKWQPEKGASFTTCASWYIKQSIIRNCMHNNRIVRLPEHISELMKDGRIDYTYSEVQIDRPNDDGNTLAETIPDTNQKLDIFHREEEELLLRKVNVFLGNLNVKEKRVIELSYGLNGHDQYDVKEIAEQLSLTTTRINQILRTSLKKMQEKI